MITLKNFKSYEGNDPKLKKLNVAFLISECGMDWYDSQKLFSENTMKIVVDKNNIVCNATRDITMMYPVDASVYEIEYDGDGHELRGKIYHEEDGTFSERPPRKPTPQQIFNDLSERKKVLDMKKEFDMLSTEEAAEYEKLISDLKEVLNLL
ncbi:TPA: hypothetical protein OGU99_000356 [Escherichia coli]|nr:hypothetical protein [Escherichia coli O157]USL83682.1 tail assembly chaperone [Escherichia phage A4]HCQ0858430.1 hypothetical protein [Escherichia coli]